VADILRERTLVVNEESGSSSWDIRLLDLERGTVSDFVTTDTADYSAHVSPDGNWIAYVSYESGQPEVYVRPAPPAGGTQRRVSDGGGTDPRWSPTGGELYFIGPDLDLMAVPIQLEPSFSAGRPESLFSVSQIDWLEVAPDETFIGLQEIPDATSDGADAGRSTNQLIVVQHWFEVLKERVPGR
jgi:Tol biopolymer transport system component